MRSKNFIVTLILIIFFLNSSFPASADYATFQVASLARETTQGGITYHQIKLTNTQEVREAYRFNVDPAHIIPFSTLIQKAEFHPSQVKLDPGETKTIDVILTLLPTVEYGKSYTVPVIVTPLVNTHDPKEVLLPVDVLNPEEIVTITVDSSSAFIPGNIVTFDVTLNNHVRKTLNDVTIDFSATLPAFSEEKMISMKDQETTTRTFTFDLPVTTKPDSYTLTVIVKDSNGGTIGAYKSYLRIYPVTSIDEHKENSVGFLTSSVVLAKENKGNTRSLQKVEYQISRFKNFFTTTTPEGTFMDGKLVWEFTLDPGMNEVIDISTSYRSILYGVILIIFVTAFLLLYVDRSVTMKKRIFMLSADSDTRVSELKILLHVRNGTKKVLSNIRIIDLIPHVIKPTQEYGTLKPNTVQHGSQSTRLIWDVEQLSPQEERIIMYKIKAQLRSSGPMILPPSNLHYMVGNILYSIRSDKLVVRQGTKPNPKTH